MTSTKLYAVFDGQPEALRARDRLTQLGLAREHINIVDQTTVSRSPNETGGRGGFWAHIKAMFMPDEDRAIIDESLRRGGYVLIATVDDQQHAAALGALEAEGAIDLEERQAQWRSAGWSGSPPPASDEPELTHPEGEAIPVVEERLRVGKREINRGSVRVRSFVVEEPVHEEVRLRDERVEVERRPVNAPTRPVAKGSPEDLLQERSVELTETAEQAVVNKEAVVTEEVRLRKKADEHVEQVDDTVRRTKVEVDDQRSGAKTESPRRPENSRPRER